MSLRYRVRLRQSSADKVCGKFFLTVGLTTVSARSRMIHLLPSESERRVYGCFSPGRWRRRSGAYNLIDLLHSRSANRGVAVRALVVSRGEGCLSPGDDKIKMQSLWRRFGISRSDRTGILVQTASLSSEGILTSFITFFSIPFYWRHWSESFPAPLPSRPPSLSGLITLVYALLKW